MRYKLVKAHSSVERMECADKIKMFVDQIHDTLVQLLLIKLGLLSGLRIHKYFSPTFSKELAIISNQLQARQSSLEFF